MAANPADATRPHPVQVAASNSNPGRNAPKVVLCGDPGVGKTAIVRTMLTGHFEQEITTTLGAEQVVIEVDSGQKINLWDIAGQMRASANNTMVFRNAQAFIVVCALDDTLTIDATRRWMRTIRYHYAQSTDTAPPPDSPDGPGGASGGARDPPMPYPTYMVFNKRDLVEPTADEKATYEDMARTLGCRATYFTTAKERADVRGMFNGVVQDLAQQLTIVQEEQQKHMANLSAQQNATGGGGGCPCGGGKGKKQQPIRRRK